MKAFLLSICCFFVFSATQGQSYLKNGKYNRLGIQGRYAVMDVSTSNISIEGGNGFQAGLTTRGRLYNNWGIIYGIDFLSINAEVATSGPSGLQDEATTYTLIGAQLNLLASYNLIGQNLSIEAGPALLVNGKMALSDRSQESNIVNGYATLTAGELQEVSRINPFAVVALTGGWESVRLSVQYQYGLTNFFGNYTNQDFTDPEAATTDFKATTAIISGGIVFYL